MKNQMPCHQAKSRARSLGWVAAVWLWAAAASWGADFAVTSPGFFYSINGAQPNPTITLVRGRTYTFSVSTAANHPFQILSPGTFTNNNISSGTLTYVVPTNAPATNNPGYRCSFHNFSGIILTIDPPTPPVPKIVSYSFGSSIILRSAPATNTFTVIPEFKTNLNNTNWFGLTVLSNRFLNGTNETFCGPPSATNLFIRLRVQ